MDVQHLFNQYIQLKFHSNFVPAEIDEFTYGEYGEGDITLFFTQYPEETFTGWAFEVQPQDPNYISHPDWSPVLIDSFPHLTVYDEQILFYLLYTINSTTTIYNLPPYHKMNDFMKNYAFFQLTQVSTLRGISEEQRQQLREFLWFFYLYAHPVNEETLYSCSFEESTLVHSKTKIPLADYFTDYHNHYSKHLLQYSNKIFITSDEIQASKSLSLALIQAIEGKSNKLNLPHKAGLEEMLSLINDVDIMLRMYAENKEQLWDIIKKFLQEDKPSPYREFCFTTLLQNFTCYILFFNFDECINMVQAFKDQSLWCEKVVNKMFGDTIFMKRIMRMHHIDISQYQTVTVFFNIENRSYYLKS